MKHDFSIPPDLDELFPDKDMLFERKAPVFDAARDMRFLRATKTYADRKVSAVWAIFCTSPLAFSAIPGRWTLTGKAEKRTCRPLQVKVPIFSGAFFFRADVRSDAIYLPRRK